MPTIDTKPHRPKRLTEAHKAESGEPWRQGKTAHERGYNYKWQQFRANYLKDNPLCVEHERQGKIKLAEVVDHIKDHKGDQKLFWDINNLQGLCTTCHNKKTASERGK